jgi:hypothetical protein
MPLQTNAQAISTLLQAIQNCQESGNKEWELQHNGSLARIMLSAPSGSGFDRGTQIDWDKSTPEKLVFQTAFHHTDDAGYYAEWSTHDVIVTPSFTGSIIRVSGRNVRGIKYYIEETFREWLDSCPGVSE